MAKEKGGKTTVGVDFTNVSEGGGGTRVPAGDYAVKVKKVLAKESSNDKPYLNWELEGLNGALKGKTIYHTTSLQEQALFNLRNTLMACKVDVPKSKMKIDLKKLIGLIMGITVEDDEYKGKIKSAVVDVFPVSIKGGKMVREALGETDEFDDEDEDLDELEESDLEEDEEETSDYTDMDLKELRALCKERGIASKGKDEEALIEALEAWDEEQEDEDDNEDEEEEVDYASMSLEELQKECKSRKIKFPKDAKKKALIKLLEEDDED